MKWIFDTSGISSHKFGKKKKKKISVEEGLKLDHYSIMCLKLELRSRILFELFLQGIFNGAPLPFFFLYYFQLFWHPRINHYFKKTK